MGDGTPQTADANDLLSVKEIGDELGMAESTAWLFVRRYNLPRYRMPARGKTTLIRRADARRAYFTPQPVDEGGAKKAAA